MFIYLRIYLSIHPPISLFIYLFLIHLESYVKYAYTQKTMTNATNKCKKTKNRYNSRSHEASHKNTKNGENYNKNAKMDGNDRL